MATTPQPASPSRPAALLQALVVVLVWGSSFVLVKMVLADVGPLTVAMLMHNTVELCKRLTARDQNDL